jgi:hypothetical protein
MPLRPDQLELLQLLDDPEFARSLWDDVLEDAGLGHLRSYEPREVSGYACWDRVYVSFNASVVPARVYAAMAVALHTSADAVMDAARSPAWYNETWCVFETASAAYAALADAYEEALDLRLVDG